jgi:biotin synthase
MIRAEVQAILDRARAGGAPSRQQCVTLLEQPEASPETSAMIALADAISRRRFGNAGTIGGQIGIEVAPCVGNCGMCVFGADFTPFQHQRLSLEEILLRARQFVDGDRLERLYLMTMHRFDLDWLLDVVAAVRRELGPGVSLVANIGDFDLAQARLLKSAGFDGVYHVCRLREGIDSRLDPALRRRTMQAAREAGLDLHTCCEPIGPEHSPQEIVDQMFLGIELGCSRHAAMRRVAVPGTPLADRGQISLLRLAQAVSVVCLANLENRDLCDIGVHEPNVLSLCSGANSICAESGANPRDTALETEQNLGLTVQDCCDMLREAGYDRVRLDGGRFAPLVATESASNQSPGK